MKEGSPVRKSMYNNYIIKKFIKEGEFGGIATGRKSGKFVTKSIM